MIEKIKFVGKYLRYSFMAKHYNGHGIHSPFIFDFVTKVLFKKDTKENLTYIETYRKELHRNVEIVDFEDFGAGSIVLKTSKKRVADIAASSSTKRKYGQLLARIIDYYKPPIILEFGSSLGVGSLYLSHFMDTTAKLITIEGDCKVAEFTRKKLNSFTGKNIQLINARFEHVLSQLIDDYATFDFIYFDGNHTKKATISYFNQCLDNSNSESIFVFDDIHWSNEMEEAWLYIQEHPKTKVCIDLFQVGIVFFRKELTTQNYIIRF